ncbi:nicotinamide riboside transporter PnuC [Olivibacter domesticus]|uniref:Nicotinamide riboside transporter PnuC n=1 Tax=Olivibacter domesticus TaxID=407022 RepID=A0A1H7IWZ5_OLID1|nr:nicotinamide riboside transporter PnuC [Olivibacter domesticus]SEK66187.1 nicotinamide mononucleotide transporter [Olivibacter domesticus]
MNISESLKLFHQQIIETPLLQLTGVGFGIAEVFLAKANKVLLYPCGIISVIITIIVLYEAGLYAEILLNIYYLVMSLYGWYYWLRRKNNQILPISSSTKKEVVSTFIIIAIGFPALFITLKYFTDSTVPVWDAWVSITAWAGMWLLAKRKLENWILLNISNAFAIPLLIHKDLILYALLTLFLFIVAIFGYISWKNKLTERLISQT